MDHPWNLEWTDERPLSRGGQGVTTLLQHRHDPSKRAVLKRIVERWRSDKQAIERLRQETETLAQLATKDAKVPRVFDSFLRYESCEPFVLMEFVEGTRFDDWLRMNAPVRPDIAAKVTLAVAKTLALCHELKIGHRDLKPANIILRGGNPHEPYVIDFGIAFDSKQTVILTEAGEIFWNEFITLPECQDQAGGHRDLRSDITALAGLFFMCLTGVAPMVLRDASDSPPHRRYEAKIRTAISSQGEGEQLLWFFDRAFAYRLSNRFQSLGEFEREITKFVGDSSREDLDVSAEIGELARALHERDRSVQLATISNTYTQFRRDLREKIHVQVRSKLNNAGELHSAQFSPKGLDQCRPSIPDGALLEDNVPGFYFTHPPFPYVATVLFAAFAVDMEIHFYATAFTAPAQQVTRAETSVSWEKIATVASLDKPNVPLLIDLISNRVQSLLAREVRRLRSKLG